MLGKINKPADNQQQKGLLLVLVQRINKNKIIINEGTSNSEVYADICLNFFHVVVTQLLTVF
jgi:hypothetical protein